MNYVVHESVLAGDEVGRVRGALAPILDATAFGTNSFVGFRTKRAFGLPAKTRALDGLLTHPVVLGYLDELLGHYLLSTAVAVEIHPGETAQTPHTDGSAWPVEDREVVVNAIWALNDFTVDNGATVVNGDPITMPAGSVLVYAGSLLHGGGANTTEHTRLALVTGYTLAWLRQQEAFTLTCPPDIAKEAPLRLRRLLGYELYPPFLGHVDGRDPEGLFEN